ncbi:MAG: DUF983 domain-containing protein [Ekhidna sp.]|nr:DUF983 domain-containing protein [Ekhidna sp.]
MFVSKAYNRKFNLMHHRCPNCNQALEPEPGFYTGAMYVSYGFQVAIIVGVILCAKIFAVNASVLWYIRWIAGIIMLLFPIIYRLSRSIWAHILIPFDN